MSATWVEGAAGSGHDVDHLPVAVVTAAGGTPYVGTRVGDLVRRPPVAVPVSATVREAARTMADERISKEK